MARGRGSKTRGKRRNFSQSRPKRSKGKKKQKLDPTAAKPDVKPKKTEKRELSDSESSDTDEEGPNPFQELISSFSNKLHDDDDESEVESASSHSDTLEQQDFSATDDDAENDSNDEVPTDSDDEESIIVNTENEMQETDQQKIDDRQQRLDVGPDPFDHYENVIEEDTVQECLKQSWSKQETCWPVLGKLHVLGAGGLESDLNPPAENALANFHIKPDLLVNLGKANQDAVKTPDADRLDSYQMEMLQLLQRYSDVLYTERTFSNGEGLRFVYCLHVLNHVLKTRSKIVHHNAKLSNKDSEAADYRDQGLTRPKVLILVPFKESAVRIVKIFCNLLASNPKFNVINKKRFQTDFASSEKPAAKSKKKPHDFEAQFSGNTDDMFRIGLAVTKKSLKLYADFYSADIIITSPLGARVILGAPGEKHRDFDFMSSIEILILDQAEVFLMQNWDHVLHIFRNLHLQPLDPHGVDFSRVRMWCLNGWSKVYRQTAIFSSVAFPALNAIFNKNCFNYGGKVRIANPIAKGTVCQILSQLPQLFHRFSTTSVSEVASARFKFFVSSILPQYKDSVMSHTLIYIPSYFDFVRIRNHFNKEEMNFVHICEYTKVDKIARARDHFFHGKTQFMLYTERTHFYHRFAIRGIRHLLFYELPTFPHFYSELCNMVRSAGNDDPSNVSCRVLYHHQNAQQLSAIVGTDRTSVMLSSSKNVHMFVTSDL